MRAVVGAIGPKGDVCVADTGCTLLKIGSGIHFGTGFIFGGMFGDACNASMGIGRVDGHYDIVWTIYFGFSPAMADFAPKKMTDENVAVDAGSCRPVESFSPTMMKLNWEGRDLHIVIDHPNRGKEDDHLFRKIVFESDVINVVPRETTVYQILEMAGLFKSRNEARRCWTRETVLKDGMTRWERVGKLKRNIYILKLPDNFPIYTDAE